MSTNTGQTQKPTIIISKPLVLKKEQLFLRPKHQLIKIRQPLYKEDVIYESKNGDFLRGEDLEVTLVNKLNLITNSSVTIAKYLQANSTVENSSERVASLIGQKNYDIVFSALCSVISQELKVRGILALLTTKPKEAATQTLQSSSKKFTDAECQTDYSSFQIYAKSKPRKRVKRQTLAPYVAKEVEKEVKKVVIYPENFKEAPKEDLTDLGLHCENSNDSIGNLSSLSITTTNSLLYNPTSLLENVDRFTRQDREVSANVEKKKEEVREEPVAMSPRTCGILFTQQNDNQDLLEKRRIAKHQALMDWNCCDQSDEDGNLPIHQAVRDNDLELLIRQCFVLNAKKKSVDVNANEDWTPLKMAILKDQPNMTSLLLRFGANPLLTDSDQKTSIHHAAEMRHAHLQAIVDHCMKNPRKILEQNDELWQDNYATMPDDRLSRLLLGRMCSMCDVQGYTPLMLASKLGNDENVDMLIRIAPTTINKQMPTCGNTALYLSIGAACTDCIERGDKTVVSPNFSRTIEALVANGADPSIDNHSGSNVNVLLTEFNIAPLSTLVANKLMSMKFEGFIPDGVKNYDKYMFVKNDEGTMAITEIAKSKKKTENVKTKKNVKQAKEPVSKPVKDTKPVIVENILLSPASSGSRKRKPSDSTKFVNVFKNFVKNNAGDNKIVKIGKAAVIKDLKIATPKVETKVQTISQPPKKRIKVVDATK